MSIEWGGADWWQAWKDAHAEYLLLAELHDAVEELVTAVEATAKMEH